MPAGASLAEMAQPGLPDLLGEVVTDDHVMYLLKSRWGTEGVFTDHYLADQCRLRLLRGAAYRTHKYPNLEIEEVPLNPIL